MANNIITHTPNYNLAMVAADQNKVLFGDFREAIAGTNNSNMQKLDNILEDFARKIQTYGFKGYYDTLAELKAAHPMGVDGEAYLVSNSLYAWSSTSNSWVYAGTIQGEKGDKGEQGIQGIQGERGVQGEQGDKGEQGVQGSLWLEGTTAPLSTVGRVGDWYINTSDYNIFEKTNATTWVNRGSIKGIQGIQGIQGEQGIQGIQGEKGDKGDKGEPGKDGTGVAIKGSYDTYAELITAHPIGVIGDGYIISGDLYVWSESDNTWINVGVIKGEQGIQGIQGERGIQGEQGVQGVQGEQGIQGIQGIQGEQGSIWLSGAGTPTSIIGKIGDWYLNTTNYDIYEKTTGSAWTHNGNIKGEQGIQGIQGEQGVKGEQGEKGDSGTPIYQAICTTEIAHSGKVATTTNGDFDKVDGALVLVNFVNGNSFKGAVLNIDGTGASPMQYNKLEVEPQHIAVGGRHWFQYDGTEKRYKLLNPVVTEADTNITVDTTLNTASNNPIANSAVANAINAIVPGTTIYQGSCPTAATTGTKVATVESGFTRTDGVLILVTFTYTNTASVITMNVNNTGAAPIYKYNTRVAETFLSAGGAHLFQWNNTNSRWQLLNPDLTEVLNLKVFTTTYNTGMANKANQSDLTALQNTVNAIKTGTTIYQGTCSTAAATTAKIVTVDDPSFELVNGTLLLVHFMNAHTTTSMTLNVNNTEAVYARYGTNHIGNNQILGYNQCLFVYVSDGVSKDWQLLNMNFATAISAKLDTITYNTGIASKANQSDLTALQTTVNAIVPGTKIYQGTCSTAAATAAKVVSVSGFTRTDEALLIVTFTNANTNASATLNANSTGAASVYVGNTIMSANQIVAGGRYLFQWNNANSRWQLLNPTAVAGTSVTVDTTLSTSSNNPIANSAVANAINAIKTGTMIYQGTCSTAVGTTAKTTTVESGFTRTDGALVLVTFSNGNTTTAPTLNVSSTGAAAIYVNGSVVSTGQMVAGGRYLFQYNSTNNRYHLLNPTAVAGTSVTVDTTLSTSSGNPIANSAVTTEINSLTTRMGTAETNISSKVNLSGGTLTGNLVGASLAIGTAGLRNIHAGTADMVAGSSTLATGRIYICYE